MLGFIETTLRETWSLAEERYDLLGGRDFQTFSKEGDEGNLVTEVDEFVENLVIMRISSAFPDDSIIAEESGHHSKLGAGEWSVDPLDGTRPFVEGFRGSSGPMISRSEGGRVTAAGIYLPGRKAMMLAEAGKGTIINGKQVQCKRESGLKGSLGLIASGHLFDPDYIAFLSRLDVAGRRPSLANSYGSIAIMAYLLLMGLRSWFVLLRSGPWDFRPASLLLKEAGFLVTDLQGKEWDTTCTSMMAGAPGCFMELFEVWRTRLDGVPDVK